MKKMPCNGSVNLLGQRMGNFDKTELSRILKSAGVQIGMQLPCGCTVNEIRRGASAKVNIVVHEIALPLAKKMKKKFGIPYVFFDKFADPGRIYECYKSLFEFLELPLPQEVDQLFAQAEKAVVDGKEKLKGMSFVYGNTPFRCFEFSRFLTSLGMEPLIIQSSAMAEEDREDIAALIKVSDPYVTKVANIAPLHYIYDEIHPWLYLGHEFPQRLRKKGIAIVHLDGAGSLLGFECTNFALRMLHISAAEAYEIRKEGGFV